MQKAVAADDTTNNQTLKPTINTMFSILAEISGNINVAFAALGVPLGIGLIGFKACESVGRNPEAAPKVLVQSIIAMAFAEAIVFFAIFLGTMAG